MGARNRQRPSWIRGRDAIKILNGLYPRSPRTPQSSSMIRGAAKASWKLGVERIGGDHAPLDGEGIEQLPQGRDFVVLGLDRALG